VMVCGGGCVCDGVWWWQLESGSLKEKLNKGVWWWCVCDCGFVEVRRVYLFRFYHTRTHLRSLSLSHTHTLSHPHTHTHTHADLITAEAAVRIATKKFGGVGGGGAAGEEGAQRSDGAIWWMNRDLEEKKSKYGAKR